MTATTENAEVARRFLAWCPECSEGVRTTKTAAQNWAYLHNKNRHNGEGNA